VGLAVLVCPDAQAGRRRLAALRIPAMRSDAAPPMAKRRRLWSLSSHAAAVSPSTASRDLVGRTRAILGSAVVPRVVCAPANNLAESAGAHWNAAAAPASSTMRVGRSMYALKLRRVRVLYPEYGNIQYIPCCGCNILFTQGRKTSNRPNRVDGDARGDPGPLGEKVGSRTPHVSARARFGAPRSVAWRGSDESV
jgi:hypothetical protein